MDTLYHVNHGCDNCVEGTVFRMFQVPAEDWAGAYPEGVSFFGLRHIIPILGCSEVPREKLEIEFHCERVRQQRFPGKRSRYQGFFALATIEEAITYREEMRRETDIAGPIWEVEADKVYHPGGMRLLTPERLSEENLRAYWLGLPFNGDSEHAIWECMVIPPVKMVRCVVHES